MLKIAAFAPMPSASVIVTITHNAGTRDSDRTAILSREIIGRDNLMWGSDFPHFDGAWPGCAAKLESQFGGVPLEDQIRIGRANAVRFYNLPLDTGLAGAQAAAMAGAPA